MHRFFVHNTPLALSHMVPGSSVSLPERVAHQVRDVLRLHSGEQLVLLDNSGDEFVVEIIKTERKSVEIQLVERCKGKSESTVRIILCQGLLKSARFEWILEKGTELGVTTFSPILCRRSTSGLEDAGPAKIQRWQRIIQEAAEQCGRSHLPELLPIRTLKQGLDGVPEHALAAIPWEEEHGQSLRDVLQTYEAKQKTVVLFIGPEGGLTPEEIVLAQEHGVQSVSLGQRILRAETAALAAVANVMYQLE